MKSSTFVLQRVEGRIFATGYTPLLEVPQSLHQRMQSIHRRMPRGLKTSKNTTRTSRTCSKGALAY